MLSHDINNEITAIKFNNGWTIEHYLDDRSLLKDKSNDEAKIIYWDNMDLRIVSPTGHVLRWAGDQGDMIRDVLGADDLAEIYVMVKEYTTEDIPTTHILEWARENNINILECINHTCLVKIFNRQLSIQNAELQVAEEYK